MEDDSSSELFVYGKANISMLIQIIILKYTRPEIQFQRFIFISLTDYNKCAEEPGYCLNGSTCEPTWTSARCHCTDRYQGDRCAECAHGYYGNDCRIDLILHH